jgi:hypothetical protein
LKNEKKVTDFVIQPTLYINNKEMVVYNKGVKIPKASAVLTLVIALSVFLQMIASDNPLWSGPSYTGLYTPGKVVREGPLTIYIVIPVSVCVGRAPRALLFPGYIILYKMVLTKGGYQKLSFEERQTMQ